MPMALRRALGRLVPPGQCAECLQERGLRPLAPSWWILTIDSSASVGVQVNGAPLRWPWATVSRNCFAL